MLQRLEFNTQTIQMVEASLVEASLYQKWKNSSKSKGHIQVSKYLTEVCHGFLLPMPSIDIPNLIGSRVFFMETRHLDLGLANRFKYERLEM